MAGQLTIDTLRASSGVLATQNGMTGIGKAWVNFDGTTGTIRGSFNVSSVTRSSTGVYVVVYTTAMPNANYAVTACAGYTQGGSAGSMGVVSILANTPLTTTQASFSTTYANATLQDDGTICIAAFSS
jgi:hypothetical protein